MSDVPTGMVFHPAPPMPPEGPIVPREPDPADPSTYYAGFPKDQVSAIACPDNLTFDLHGETFALEAELVREVLDLLPETPVPGAQPHVSAVINFRGRIIPLIDLLLKSKASAVAMTMARTMSALTATTGS